MYTRYCTGVGSPVRQRHFCSLAPRIVYCSRASARKAHSTSSSRGRPRSRVTTFFRSTPKIFFLTLCNLSTADCCCMLKVLTSTSIPKLIVHHLIERPSRQLTRKREGERSIILSLLFQFHRPERKGEEGIVSLRNYTAKERKQAKIIKYEKKMYRDFAEKLLVFLSCISLPSFIRPVQWSSNNRPIGKPTIRSSVTRNTLGCSRNYHQILHIGRWHVSVCSSNLDHTS